MAPVARKKVQAKKVSPIKRRPSVRGLPLSGSESLFSYDPWGTSGKVHDNCYDYAFGSFSNRRPTKSVPGDRSGVGSNGLTFTKCTGIAERIQSDNPSAVYRMRSMTQRCKPGYYKVVCMVAPSNDFGNSTGDFHFLKQIGSVRYRIRAGDTIKGLSKFFHVRPEVIQNALRKTSSPLSPTNGRISNSNLKVLNKNNEKVIGLSQRLFPGKIIQFPANLFSHKTGWAGGPLLVDAAGKTIVDPRKANFKYRPGFHYTKICSIWGVKRGMARTGSNANR
jgi:hypothetical protein